MIKKVIQAIIVRTTKIWYGPCALNGQFPIEIKTDVPSTVESSKPNREKTFEEKQEELAAWRLKVGFKPVWQDKPSNSRGELETGQSYSSNLGRFN